MARRFGDRTGAGHRHGGSAGTRRSSEAEGAHPFDCSIGRGTHSAPHGASEAPSATSIRFLSPVVIDCPTAEGSEFSPATARTPASQRVYALERNGTRRSRQSQPIGLARRSAWPARESTTPTRRASSINTQGTNPTALRRAGGLARGHCSLVGAAAASPCSVAALDRVLTTLPVPR